MIKDKNYIHATDKKEDIPVNPLNETSNPEVNANPVVTPVTPVAPVEPVTPVAPVANTVQGEIPPVSAVNVSAPVSAVNTNNDVEKTQIFDVFSEN